MIPTYNPAGEPKRFTAEQIEHNRRLADLDLSLRNEAAGYTRWTAACEARGRGKRVTVTVKITLEPSSRDDGRFAVLTLKSTATGGHMISEPFNNLSDVAHTLERFRGHFNGFLATQGVPLPQSGDRIGFSRGMFGAWTGTVDRRAVPKRPEAERYLVILFRKRNGAQGTYRALWSEVERGYATKESR